MTNQANVAGQPARIITIEEHFATPAFLEGPGHMFKQHARMAPLVDRLSDLGDRRIANMDAAGIDVQVLSLVSPGVNQMEPDAAVELARGTNDFLAQAVAGHPDRFAGFAVLPMSAPDAAAGELERMVRQHGFNGAVINGHSRGRYLDDPFFWPILERAETLRVPIYLHPAQPPKPVVDASYAGNFSPEVTYLLSTSAWGWHIETALHILRIILGGAFDRFPDLQLVIGHLGEALPFMLPRIDRNLPVEVTGLRRPIAAYLRENLYYTVSGFNFIPAFLDLLLEIGVSRMIFSADYPFASNLEAREFLDRLPVSPADKKKIAHENAEYLLRM